jgi:hypothetical protein
MTQFLKMLYKDRVNISGNTFGGHYGCSSRFASFARWLLMRNITGIHAKLGTEYLN